MSRIESGRSQDNDCGVRYGLSDHYTGERGRLYQERRFNLPLTQMARIHAAKFAPVIHKTNTVLDFGCGSGEILAAIPAARKIGIEVNPHAREAAQMRGIECYADMSQIPEGTVDVVISHHALEHVPYPIQALKEFARVLKPSGTLRLCVPVEYPHKANNYDPADVAHHLHTWTVQLLGNTLVEAGFEVKPDSVWTMARRYPRPLLRLYPRLPHWVSEAIGQGFATVRRHKELMANVHPIASAAP